MAKRTMLKRTCRVPLFPFEFAILASYWKMAVMAKRDFSMSSIFNSVIYFCSMLELFRGKCIGIVLGIDYKITSGVVVHLGLYTCRVFVVEYLESFVFEAGLTP